MFKKTSSSSGVVIFSLASLFINLLPTRKGCKIIKNLKNVALPKDFYFDIFQVTDFKSAMY